MENAAPDPGHVDTSDQEVESLRAALHDAEEELARTKAKRRRGGRTRRIITGFLVFLTCLVFTLAITAGWTRRTLFNTGQYVRTVTPLIEHPSVTEGLSERITAELMAVIDAPGLAAEALPLRAQLLIGPIVGSIEDFMQDQVNELLASDRFAEFWVNANRFAHTQIMAVLHGEEGASLSTADGTVTLNLLPVINEVLVRVEERAGGLLGKDIDLPEVSGGELPEEARAKLEAALGRDLPDNLGEIVIFESDKLEAAQDGLELIDRSVIILLVLAVLLIALTLWISRSRRRTTIQICVGVLIGMVAMRRLVIYIQEQAVDLAKPSNQDAMRDIVDDLMRNFFRLTAFVIAIGLVVMAIALITGPYPWAVKLRRRTRELATSLTSTVQSRAHDDSTTAWVRAHRDALMAGGAIFLVLMVLWLDLSWIGFFLLAALVGAFELAVVRIGRDDTDEPPSDQQPSSTVSAPSS